jgi:hypothetical protein
MAHRQDKSSRRAAMFYEDLKAVLTQSLYSSFIRIRAVASKDELEEQIERAVNAWVASHEQQPPPPPPPPPDDTERLGSTTTAILKEQMGMMADVCTGLWRLRQKLIKPGSHQPIVGSERAYRHFVSVWDVIVATGFKIQDHTGDDYHPLQQLKVLSFEPTPGIEREQVLETIKPSIYYKDRCIQIGEVVVATP